jgi:hypothetical protein
VELAHAPVIISWVEEKGSNLAKLNQELGLGEGDYMFLVKEMKAICHASSQIAKGQEVAKYEGERVKNIKKVKLIFYMLGLGNLAEVVVPEIAVQYNKSDPQLQKFLRKQLKGAKDSNPPTTTEPDSPIDTGTAPAATGTAAPTASAGAATPGIAEAEQAPRDA